LQNDNLVRCTIIAQLVEVKRLIDYTDSIASTFVLLVVWACVVSLNGTEMKRMKNEEDIYETTLAIASFAACLVKINSQSFADKGSTKAAERK